MRFRALSCAVALFAFAGCDAPVHHGGTTDGRQAVQNGNGNGEALTCTDAQDSFRTCWAAAPSCERLEYALRTCVGGEAPGNDDGRPPRRDRNDPPPPPNGDGDAGDDDRGDRNRRRGGGDDGDSPGHGDDGTGPDGRDCDPYDTVWPNPCPPPPGIPDHCQPLADDLIACMYPCEDERDVMEMVCATECDAARDAADACIQSTPACTDRGQGIRACLRGAWQICAADADTALPSQACIEAVAMCLTQGDSCRATCGDLVRTARLTCEAGGHGHHHGHHDPVLCEDEGSGGSDDPYVDGWLVEPCPGEESGGGAGGSSGEGISDGSDDGFGPR